jgi:3-oxoacid CoA-transferase subunit A
MRAGGAGIPGFYTKTGVGTVVAEGKEHKEFDGADLHPGARHRGGPVDREGLEGRHDGERGLPQDLAQLQPARGDVRAVCVMEVEEIVEPGSLEPDHIHLPGIYVHRIVQGTHEKRIEQRTVRPRPAA